ncbi:hypothetical protein FA13DRAFT_1787157 [Coprinellus micaceus]|uniref:Uncharacterized protein n=1 Tax=Coprinellus micaceus TaxID=71717 RepID=A0A4Y7TT84_COPMI|nr:hypothetical protein FA13DRAFT_1787157 [Coprinellus micaceus]
MLATASFQPSRPHVLATPFPSPSRTHPALDYSNTPEATPPPLNNPSPRFRCLTIFAFSCFSNRAVSPRHRNRPNPIIQVREELEKALRPDLQEPTFELIQLEVQRRYYAKWHTALSSRPPYLHNQARATHRFVSVLGGTHPPAAPQLRLPLQSSADGPLMAKKQAARDDEKGAAASSPSSSLTNRVVNLQGSNGSATWFRKAEALALPFSPHPAPCPSVAVPTFEDGRQLAYEYDPRSDDVSRQSFPRTLSAGL